MRLGVTLVGAALVAGSVACSAADPATGSAAGVGEWVHARTGECSSPRVGSIEEFAEFVGPLRADLYAPFVQEWATCAVAPYEKLGLVVFRPGVMREFQEAWKASVAAGEVVGDPDFAFGPGFAVSATDGLERLGLRYLHCTPVEGHVMSPEPAEAEGCVYTKMHQGHGH
ncbi:hypothetical protein ACFFQW_22205 [Umezawaea endophytica]|uniref:Lipoprotein n=1 Tax=Umezawaea endophytica TaxID=1654476 RepID=A0A9X2VJ54_9PSEU|nr:hypothetical protein [Umezawaea endophytica]MCS7477462.1 hypothetical protein [Umezawaea endophytica]